MLAATFNSPMSRMLNQLRALSLTFYVDDLDAQFFPFSLFSLLKNEQEKVFRTHKSSECKTAKA
jgi:hypothetical protein